MECRLRIHGVQISRGVYELLVFVRHFEIGARSGDTSGGVGLWVDERKPQRIVRASAIRTLCRG